MAFHFSIAREDFLHAISAQQNITSKKGTLAILSNVFIVTEQDKIIMTGTDLEIGLKQILPAEVMEQGNLTLPAKKLFEIARESKSEIISFREQENNWVEITTGSSIYKLAGMVADEYPQFPKYDEEAMVEIDASVMTDLIDKTIFSIAMDNENIYSLTAALLRREEIGKQIFLKLISSDGHRLTIMKKEVDNNIKGLHLNPVTLLPRRGIQEIRKFGEDKDTFRLGIEKKQAVLKSKDSLLIIRLMEGDFPDFQSVIDIISKENFIEINRLLLLESLKRINLFTEDMFRAVKIEVGDNHMLLSSQNADFGSAKDELDVVYSGEPLSLVFNCRYFIDTLQVMEGDIVKLTISSDESPCLVTSDEDEGFLSIVMPMKL